MAEQRKQYTREFKLEAVRLLEESGRSKAQIARELGIHESLPKSLGVPTFLLLQHVVPLVGH